MAVVESFNINMPNAHGNRQPAVRSERPNYWVPRHWTVRAVQSRIKLFKPPMPKRLRPPNGESPRENPHVQNVMRWFLVLRFLLFGDSCVCDGFFTIFLFLRLCFFLFCDSSFVVMYLLFVCDSFWASALSVQAARSDAEDAKTAHIHSIYTYTYRLIDALLRHLINK